MVLTAGVTVILKVSFFQCLAMPLRAPLSTVCVYPSDGHVTPASGASAPQCLVPVGEPVKTLVREGRQRPRDIT